MARLVAMRLALPPFQGVAAPGAIR